MSQKTCPNTAGVCATNFLLEVSVSRIRLHFLPQNNVTVQESMF